ncbi:hypothetical protein ACWCYY_34715 [Kitasatospora sp. NPDC001664]|uniref:hypothetical protein n=1 Tax=Kitasatospora albolonga TaxID=68173 RepID=UPI0035E4C9C3
MSAGRRPLGALVAAVAVLGTSLVLAAPAEAAGGGCYTPPTNSYGWNVGVCSSDNGVTVSGDVYVNQRGSLGSSCRVSYGLYDETDQKYVALSDKYQACYTGRHPAIHATKVPGHNYRNYAGVVVDNRTVYYQSSYVTW